MSNGKGNSGNNGNSGNSGNSPKQISSPFYLQWQVSGSSKNGQWKISTTGSNPWSSLSSYDIKAGTYTIYFSGANNGNGSPYTVFTQVSGGTAHPDFGVRFSTAGSNTKAATLQNYQTNGSLTFAAAELISGDPKINLSTSNSKSGGSGGSGTEPQEQCWLLWISDAWYYSYSEPSDLSNPSLYQRYSDDNHLELLADATLYVTDATSTSNTCAVYQGHDDTNSGQYYAHVSQNPQTMRQAGQAFEFSARENDTCTINLFTWLGSNGSL